jgi:hypothetical protein
MRRALLFVSIFLLGCAQQRQPFHAQSLEQSLQPIRPGPPFWNGHAKQFMVVPSFDIAKTAGAFSYRFTVGSHSFTATQPTALLSPIWSAIPSGPAVLEVQALDANKKLVGPATTRPFHRAAIFDGPYGSPVLPYDKSADTAIDGLIHEPFVQSWVTLRQPDPSYGLYRYASKTIPAVVNAAVLYANQKPRADDGDRAIEIGRIAADYLIGISRAAGSRFEYFPPTYHNAKPTDRENDDYQMMNAPAEAAQGYLNLYGATGDQKYLGAAGRIGDTYVKTQLPSGTWPLKVDVRTGKSLADIDLIPAVVITLLDGLIRDEHQPQYQSTLDRAVAWMMDNPVRTFNWQAQFEDAKLRGPYENLGKHEACEFASYLFARGSEENVRTAEELLRFAEDQFVVWEHPPQIKARSVNLDPKNWFLPCSLEQYAMFEPISGSSAFMIVAYIRAYDRTHKAIYLAKAQSLANALTVAQRYHHGRYPTRMIREDLLHWINSTVNTAAAMKTLSETQRAHQIAR